MNDKPIFYDTDCLSSFLGVNKINILEKLYSQIIISTTVKEEFFNQSTPNPIKERLQNCINKNYVQIKDLELDSKEFNTYYELYTSLEGENDGKGELTTIALAKTYNGIIASNNLKDICKYIKKFNLKHITTSVILQTSYKKGHITLNEACETWNKMINNGIKLPEKSFKDYISKKDHLCYQKSSKKRFK